MNKWLQIFVFGLLLSAFCSALYGQGSVEQDAEKPIDRLRRQYHIWDQSVRGFRREHNFSTSLGGGFGEWRIARIGEVEDELLEVSNYHSRFVYSFHIPIYRGFGYFLGSTVGIAYERFTEQRATVDTVYSIPGVLVGLTHNFSPAVRVSVGLDHYLERFEGFLHSEASAGNEKLSIATNVSDWFATMDLFYKLNWGVRIEGHSRKTVFSAPARPQDYLVGASMSRYDRWYGVGLVYHLM